MGKTALDSINVGVQFFGKHTATIITTGRPAKIVAVSVAVGVTAVGLATGYFIYAKAKQMLGSGSTELEQQDND